MADVVTPEDRLGDPLVRRIGLCLDRIHRDWPPALPRQDSLVIPVGALDEAQGDGEILPSRPGQQLIDVRIALAQVCLHRQTEVGVGAELGVGPQTAVQLERDVLEAPHLCVEAEEAAERDDLPVQGLEARQHSLDGALEIGRVRQREQRRRLDRYVNPRRMAPVEPLPVLSQGGPPALGFLQGIQQCPVAGGVLVGLALADGRLPEDVQRKREALFPQRPEPGYRLRHGGADDEIAGHHLEILPNGSAHRRLCQTTAPPQPFKAPLEDRRQGLLMGEVFLEMAAEGVRRRQVGQHIDEPEELDLEPLILHARVQNLPGPGALVEERGALVPDAGEERSTARSDSVLQFVLAHAWRPLARSEVG